MQSASDEQVVGGEGEMIQHIQQTLLVTQDNKSIGHGLPSCHA